MSRIVNAIALNEPVLLTRDTRTGKTSVITHLAHILHQPLISGTSKAKRHAFERDVDEFSVQYVSGKGRLAVDFVEGLLVQALREGEWILLDEVNLATAETPECIANLLRKPTVSITLTEQESLEPVPRHPIFHLFACMNPATEVDKNDVPPNIRPRFTKINVPPPDAVRETLIAAQYIGLSEVSDKVSIMDVWELYIAVKHLAETCEIADRANHRSQLSMRTLARVITFAFDIASTYGLQRVLWEGCLMEFTMFRDIPSSEKVFSLAEKHLLAGIKNVRSALPNKPTLPPCCAPQNFVKLGPFLEHGLVPLDPADDYISAPSTEKKLIVLARIIFTRRFPVPIEVPTSSGKTSSIEYLAKRTGRRFIPINNHEQTDIQQYIGSYVLQPVPGGLAFTDGLLIRALQSGDWIVLDEVNLARTDVLEALNRLLDDNQELVIPETAETVRPLPHFVLFAAQNPSGLYAGTKVLSRASRNRFLEVHFQDVLEAELEIILCQRCMIAILYGEKDAVGYQGLVENYYMLLTERARRDEDKIIVKVSRAPDFAQFLDCDPSSASLIWTKAMQRLFVVVARAVRFNEPILLVGETGSGKTSVRQNTETADLIGGLGLTGDRASLEADALRKTGVLSSKIGSELDSHHVATLQSQSDMLLKSTTLTSPTRNALEKLQTRLCVTGMSCVLEPSRTLVLAEKAADHLHHYSSLVAHEFQLVATMNPGGDY
ncbi:P-loop containing nucleoside triphosphate hydrolase protein [Lentinula edodes]|nr:P-loop containing nucleoside triphosphate hydrolase protein [Lentinula edodes]